MSTTKWQNIAGSKKNFSARQVPNLCKLFTVSYILRYKSSGTVPCLQKLERKLAETIDRALFCSNSSNRHPIHYGHGLRTPSEEIAFTAQPKIKSQSQIFRYGRSKFCLPQRPKFSDFFDLCLHWVSVVRDYGQFDQRQRVLVTKSRREKHKSPDIYSLVNSEYTAVGETRGAGIGEPDAIHWLTFRVCCK